MAREVKGSVLLVQCNQKQWFHLTLNAVQCQYMCYIKEYSYCTCDVCINTAVRNDVSVISWVHRCSLSYPVKSVKNWEIWWILEWWCWWHVVAVIDVLWWLKTWIVAGITRVRSGTRPSTTPRVWCSTCSRRLVAVLWSTVTITDTRDVRMCSCTAAVQVCRGSLMMLTILHCSARASKTLDTRSVCQRVLSVLHSLWKERIISLAVVTIHGCAPADMWAHCPQIMCTNASDAWDISPPRRYKHLTTTANILSRIQHRPVST